MNSAIINLTHWHQPINQLYHPTGVLGSDKYQIVYTKNKLNKTKFYPILLKEWFFLLRKNGLLVIDYQPNKLCDWQKLEATLWWLWSNRYQIIYHQNISSNQSFKNLRLFINKNKNKGFIKPISNNKPVRLVCQKLTTTTIKNDSINKWTFGVITNGKRPDWLAEIITSIRKQKIPHYEIIVCGTYHGLPAPDIIYLPFNHRDYLGWITRKKNLIIKKAQYQNICLLHDRIILHSDWFKGIKKWGNCFEVIINKTVIQGSDDPVLDYLVYKNLDQLNINQLQDYFVYIPAGNIQYRDWDKNAISYSCNFITKKYILEQNPYNETTYWNQYEDLLMSQENIRKGILIRMNPAATYQMKIQTIKSDNQYFDFNQFKLGKYHHHHFLLIIGCYFLQLFKVKKTPKLLKLLKLFRSWL